MKVAEAICHSLVCEGVRFAAGITGQSIGHVADALAEHDEVNVIYARQERVAFDICDGFARASGRPAVVFSDAGPAAANAMGGLVNSWGDSVPVLFIAGHNNRSDMPTGDTKEIPFRALFGPVSKWVAVIEEPEQAGPLLRRAFMHLTTGRPGPVVIGMPYDISSKLIHDFTYEAVGQRPRVRAAGDPAAVAAAADMLLRSERPFVYAGAGVLFSEATPELIALAEALALPVATTLNGKSAFPEDHELALGIGGFARAQYGSLPATVLAQEADVILTLGCGFKKHATRGPRPIGSRHIQVDVDPGEINKHHIADAPILGDAKLVLSQLLEAVRARKATRPGMAQTRARVAALRDRWNTVCAPLLTSEQTPVNPFRVTRELARLLPRDRSIMLHDAGSVRGTTCQHYPAITPRSFLGFGVQSAMGWSIGAAIGAKAAEPTKIVCAVIGEEAFNETAMDIETSIRGRLPVLIIVKNNRAYVDHDGGKSQKLATARFAEGVDIASVAMALGARAFKVEEPSVLAKTLAEAIASVEAGRTAVVEIKTIREKASLHRLWE